MSYSSVQAPSSSRNRLPARIATVLARGRPRGRDAIATYEYSRDRDSTHISIGKDPTVRDMTPLQYAPRTDVRSTSVNSYAEDPERSTGNAASQSLHRTLEEVPPRGSKRGVGEMSHSRSSFLASPIASNLPEKQSMSSNNSQSTVYTGTSPPSSLSAPSSQNNLLATGRVTQLDTMSEPMTNSAQDGVHPGTVQPESQPNALHIHTTPTSPTTASFAAQTLSHGQKRTASGQTKPSSSSLPTSPVEGAGRGHSRNTSVNSSSTQIGELSLQLRTRLSYAMVKVQHGWQSRSLGEVENLAAQHVSPTSNPSTFNTLCRVQHSPERSSHTPAKARGDFSPSSERDVEATRLQSHAIHDNLSVNPALPAHLYQSPLNKQTSPSSTEPPTYESFWRQHSARPSGSNNPPVQSAKPTGPSLEPPAHIFSRNTRRSKPHQVQTPTLYTQSLSNLSTSSETSAQSFVPATPPPASQRRATATRTPSQNAAMEKDAVETLLFMSSPVNPGYHKHSRNGLSPGTPVRTPNRVAGKHVGFAATGTGGSADRESSDDEPRSLSLPRSRTSQLHSGLGRVDKEDDIDRMLDAMDSSSDDEI